jgi:hypothetical protein
MKQYLASSSKAYRKAQVYLKDFEEPPAPFLEKSANPGSGTTSAKPKELPSHQDSSGDSDEAASDSSESSEDDDDEWVKNLEQIEEDMQSTQVRLPSQLI